METWKRLGSFLGSHMPFIVPTCVVIGVLLPDQFSPIKAFVPILFAIMTFQGSLNNTLGELIEEFRRPVPLIAILVTMLVIMPVLAFVLGSLCFPNNNDIVTGLVLSYSIPVGIVCYMWVGMFSGNGSLGLAAILVSTLVSPFSIPLTLQLLMGKTVHVDVASMMFDMAVMIALPALLGMIANDLTRGWGKRTLSPAAAPLCKIFLIMVITSNATSISPLVAHLNAELVGSIFFVFAFTTSGFAWGLIIARVLGQSRANAVTMGFSCGLRNISSGAVIAAQYFPGEALFPVICGTLFQQTLASVFGNVVNRVVGEAPVSGGELAANDAAAVDELGAASDEEACSYAN